MGLLTTPTRCFRWRLELLVESDLVALLSSVMGVVLRPELFLLLYFRFGQVFDPAQQWNWPMGDQDAFVSKRSPVALRKRLVEILGGSQNVALDIGNHHLLHRQNQKLRSNRKNLQRVIRFKMYFFKFTLYFSRKQTDTVTHFFPLVKGPRFFSKVLHSTQNDRCSTRPRLSRGYKNNIFNL